MSTLNAAALGSLSSPGEAGSPSPAFDIDGALELFRPERRRRDAADRAFVYQRVGGYAPSLCIVAMAGCTQLLLVAGLLATYLQVR